MVRSKGSGVMRTFMACNKDGSVWLALSVTKLRLRMRVRLRVKDGVKGTG